MTEFEVDALKVCSTCPAWKACTEYADRFVLVAGIWGRRRTVADGFESHRRAQAAAA